MHLRPRFFLALTALCTAPLLALSLFSFLANSNAANTSLRAELKDELDSAITGFDALLQQRNRELSSLAVSGPLIDYFRNQAGAQLASAATDPPHYARDTISLLLTNQNAYSSIAAFDSHQRLLFVAEPAADNGSGPVIFRTNALTENEAPPDSKVWSAKAGETVCWLVTKPARGKILRCGTPVMDQAVPEGTLVADLRLDSMLGQIARGSESRTTGQENGFEQVLVVLDTAGEIVYHTNDALRHQQVTSSFPDFQPVAALMKRGEVGTQQYRSTEGDDWLAAYAPLSSSGLSIAIARNRSSVLSGTRFTGWLGLLAAFLLGIGLASILTLLYRRKTQSIERVTQDVAEIAKGKLDLHLEARSRDDIRPLADSVNLMTERLRQQIAREAETRQFQSFVRLSAMLTHDLKNAIGSLSLLVSNMEQHFDNEQFRADAMQSLRNATQKLRALVERIRNPVTTLSGEFKRPEAVDLVPLIKRTVAQASEPTGSIHEIEIDLPPSLFALVDAERIERVVENLVLNAFEAMTGKRGKLRVEGGRNDEGQTYFVVSDTGIGMSQTFIDERLFHAFSTTKKKGMGLGLYTCREVVRANGGTIEVNSKQGAGTTFRVVLPSPPTEKKFSNAEPKVISSQF